MPSITYRDKLPPPGEFQKSLAEAMANANPVDDLLELANRLWRFEEQYELPSADFYRAYQAGALDDALQHCIQWAATYETFLKTKRKLESALMRAVVQLETLAPAVPIHGNLYQDGIGSVEFFLQARHSCRVNPSFFDQIDHFGQCDARKRDLVPRGSSILDPGTSGRREPGIVVEIPDEGVCVDDGRDH